MSYKLRLITDKLSANLFLVFSLFAILTVVLIGYGLYYKSAPILHDSSLWHLLSSTEWKPFKNEFGFFSYIIGSLVVTGIAIIIALPLSLFAAIYIAEYAPHRLRQILVPLIDLLSGIPPVVYGVWGVLTIVPYISDHLAPHFVEFSSGYCALAGGLVLAVMVFPLIISILLEVFDTIPKELKDASLSLGATQWETTRKVVLKKSVPGIIAATVLGISRAIGETLAVLMVCGNLPMIPHSLFDSVYPLPALIANNYGDMMSIPMYESALMLSAFILFIIIFIFNAVSRLILYRIENRA
ncbi:MAG TPA: phosphate ABC transporter permease subunit PstC [Ferruginibacter sp.]|jgi:phosphate transport system permease protein|nr:phosphate ABC transporter permease subunit PstC [Ferruginibacter sp.]